MYLIQHWAWLIPLCAVGVVVARLLWRNQDLQPYRRALFFSCLLVVGALALGWFVVAGIDPKWASLASGLFLTAFGAWCCLRVVDRAFSGSAGGLLFDLIFSDGTFSEKWSAPPKLPSLTMLLQWRANGGSRKACRVGKRYLTEQREAYPMWLFVAETAAAWHSEYSQAERIIRRLCRSRAFSDDEKLFAVNSLKAWVAPGGYDLDTSKLLRGHRSCKRPSAMVRADRLCQEGRVAEAEKLLKTLCSREPDNLAAVLLLARIYAQEPERIGKAERLIEAVARRPFTPSYFEEYARRSIEEWKQSPPSFAPKRATEPSRPASALESGPDKRQNAAPDADPTGMLELAATESYKLFYSLLQEGYLGTTIAQLEEYLKAHPDDFACAMLLLETWLDKLDNVRKAEDLLRAIGDNPGFSQEQRESAAGRLKVWKRQRREGRPGLDLGSLRMAEE